MKMSSQLLLACCSFSTLPMPVTGDRHIICPLRLSRQRRRSPDRFFFHIRIRVNKLRFFSCFSAVCSCSISRRTAFFLLCRRMLPNTPSRAAATTRQLPHITKDLSYSHLVHLFTASYLLQSWFNFVHLGVIHTGGLYSTVQFNRRCIVFK